MALMLERFCEYFFRIRHLDFCSTAAAKLGLEEPESDINREEKFDRRK